MIKDTGITDLLLIEPKVFKDERGYFFESYNRRIMENNRLNHQWVQDNESLSCYGTLRGLHYQVGENAQAKLVRVIKGEVLDVVVDLRKTSPTYGQHFSQILNEDNKLQLIVPRGFAHGFIVLSESAIFSYKCDNFYNKDSEGCINAMDEDLKIDWLLPTKDILRSEKDKNAPTFVNSIPSGL